METIKVTLTQEEVELVERYARKHRVTVEEAFKNAIFDRIEEEMEMLHKEIEKDLQKSQPRASRLFEEEIEELRHN